MTGPPTIARAGIEHAETLSLLHRDCFDIGWSAASFAEFLNSEKTLGFFAVSACSAQTMQAFILTRIAAEEAEILTLGTAPKYRRGGLAQALVLAASSAARAMGANELFLEVAVSNAPARGLYSSLGFAPAGVRPGYYVSHAQTMDALILRAALPLRH
jgi:ribosomal-protein-alanine N-acetyltransferase